MTVNMDIKRPTYEKGFSQGWGTNGVLPSCLSQGCAPCTASEVSLLLLFLWVCLSSSPVALTTLANRSLKCTHPIVKRPLNPSAWPIKPPQTCILYNFPTAWTPSSCPPTPCPPHFTPNLAFLIQFRLNPHLPGPQGRTWQHWHGGPTPGKPEGQHAAPQGTNGRPHCT